MITLVDEDEDEFPTKYLAEKNGLSGGWRGFSIDHELVDGDALVFQLINPTTFKVSSWTQIDALLVPFRALKQLHLQKRCINVACKIVLYANVENCSTVLMLTNLFDNCG